MADEDRIQVVCVAEFFAREGKTDELLRALQALIAPTRSESGCLRYELNQRVDDPAGITFIEKWTDKKAFDDHCSTPYISDFFNNIRPELVARFEVKLYEEIHP